MLASLLLSQGVPMLLAGDECRRTQRGNNNAYCQDNDISWFDWKLVEKNEGLLRFCQSLIAFRRTQPTVRQADFLRGEPAQPGELPDVSWFGPDGRRMNWSSDPPSLTCFFAAPPGDFGGLAGRHVLMMLHAGGEPREFTVPTVSKANFLADFCRHAAGQPQRHFPRARWSRAATQWTRVPGSSFANGLRLRDLMRRGAFFDG